MKTKFNIRNTFSLLLLAMLFLMGTSDLIAQENNSTEIKDFKIIVEKTKNGIKMNSTKGCAWIDLSFTLNNNTPQAIDEYGMTDLNNVPEIEDKKLADFLFTMIKTENGIELKGIEGTAWLDLKISLGENQKAAITEHGIAHLDN